MTQPANNCVLAVDLDGSLINTDLLHESIIQLLFTKPWLILCLPFWLSKGKTYLKECLHHHVNLDTEHLPWNNELIAYLETQYSQGRQIVLCTGSWHALAEQIFERFDFFSACYGTTTDLNLTGDKKAAFLVDKYGEKGFSYVGNEAKDIAVWHHANSAVVVNRAEKLHQQTAKECAIEKSIINPNSLSLRSFLKQIRIHQWVKNSLIFVPLVTSHQLSEPRLLALAALAFVAFGLCASATYIINDLADLKSDRKNAKKRYRPIAAGEISIPQGIFLAGFLLVGSLLVATQVNLWFVNALLLYTAITLAYSFKLKRLQSMDITVLAGLFTLRIIAGAAAVDVVPSFWLLAFSMFIFLCLAIIKRLSEIINNQERYTEDTKLSGRGYYIGDLQVLMSLATAAGMLSVLVFAMYINSPETVALYSEPYALWLICPLFAYWIIRIIIMASRGQVDEDPILFAIKDSRSWITGTLILLIIFISSI